MGVVRCVGNTGSQSHAPENTIEADFAVGFFYGLETFFLFFFFVARFSPMEMSQRGDTIAYYVKHEKKRRHSCND